MSDATCKTCRYCEPLGFERSSCDGECHRTAPLPTPVEHGSDFFAIWPLVIMGSDWCGEHPERQPHLEGLSTTLVTAKTDGPTAADMRRIVDALEKMATCAARAKP